MAHQAQREEIEHKKFVDYKDTTYLSQFTDPHARILPHRRTGIAAARQREIALAIKRSRYMALLPYIAS
ncbi:MAG TPA: 30S ribosomal protein S18 [Candidatus Kaiserbacteria bacterium]|nr:30S ribosomal protein S18 [Candidatus Kaiserbacteria bacterium]